MTNTTILGSSLKEFVKGMNARGSFDLEYHILVNEKGLYAYHDDGRFAPRELIFAEPLSFDDELKKDMGETESLVVNMKFYTQMLKDLTKVIKAKDEILISLEKNDKGVRYTLSINGVKFELMREHKDDGKDISLATYNVLKNQLDGGLDISFASKDFKAIVFIEMSDGAIKISDNYKIKTYPLDFDNRDFAELEGVNYAIPREVGKFKRGDTLTYGLSNGKPYFAVNGEERYGKVSNESLEDKIKRVGGKLFTKAEIVRDVELAKDVKALNKFEKIIRGYITLAFVNGACVVTSSKDDVEFEYIMPSIKGENGKSVQMKTDIFLSILNDDTITSLEIYDSVLIVANNGFTCMALDMWEADINDELLERVESIKSEMLNETPDVKGDDMQEQESPAVDKSNNAEAVNMVEIKALEFKEFIKGNNIKDSCLTLSVNGFELSRNDKLKKLTFTNPLKELGSYLDKRFVWDITDNIKDIRKYAKYMSDDESIKVYIEQLGDVNYLYIGVMKLYLYRAIMVEGHDDYLARVSSETIHSLGLSLINSLAIKGKNLYVIENEEHIRNVKFDKWRDRELKQEFKRDIYLKAKDRFSVSKIDRSIKIYKLESKNGRYIGLIGNEVCFMDILSVTFFKEYQNFFNSIDTSINEAKTTIYINRDMNRYLDEQALPELQKMDEFIQVFVDFGTDYLGYALAKQIDKEMLLPFIEVDNKSDNTQFEISHRSLMYILENAGITEVKVGKVNDEGIAYAMDNLGNIYMLKTKKCYIIFDILMSKQEALNTIAIAKGYGNSFTEAEIEILMDKAKEHKENALQSDSDYGDDIRGYRVSFVVEDEWVCLADYYDKFSHKVISLNEARWASDVYLQDLAQKTWDKYCPNKLYTDEIMQYASDIDFGNSYRAYMVKGTHEIYTRIHDFKDLEYYPETESGWDEFWNVISVKTDSWSESWAVEYLESLNIPLLNDLLQVVELKTHKFKNWWFEYRFFGDYAPINLRAEHIEALNAGLKALKAKAYEILSLACEEAMYGESYDDEEYDSEAEAEYECDDEECGA